MKKFLFSCVIALFLGITTSSIHASLLDDSLAWAYTNNLTRYFSPDYFLPNNSIRRDEASKFFVNFAKLIGKTTYTRTASACQFADTNKAISDLQDYVIESCRLGIFNGANGKFYPANNLTNAEAIAVLIRIVSGFENESGLSHRANIYYSKANSLDLLDNVNMNSKDGVARRGNVISILYEARSLKGDTNNSEESNSYNLYVSTPTSSIPLGESIDITIETDSSYRGKMYVDVEFWDTNKGKWVVAPEINGNPSVWTNI
jgi:hypothetical protein